MTDSVSQQLIPIIEKLFNLNLDKCTSFTLRLDRHKPPEIVIHCIPELDVYEGKELEMGKLITCELAVVPKNEKSVGWTCLHDSVKSYLKSMHDFMKWTGRE